MSEPEVVVTREGRVATVRLNRPERANSVTPEVVDSMGGAVRELMDDEQVGAVVLTGTGKAFCAGADVHAMHRIFADHGIGHLADYLVETWMPAVQRAIMALWAAPKPTVAALNGAAAAGGMDFALTCDVRVATQRTRLTESYINLGMVPVGGGAYLLSTLVGPSVAAELVTSGRVLSADEARDAGLLTEVVEQSELATAAAGHALRLSVAPQAAVAAAKSLAKGAYADGFDAALSASLEANARLLKEPAVRERLTAVMTDYGERASR